MEVVLQRFSVDDTILKDRTGRDTAGPGAEGGMGNAVCPRCCDRVQIASRSSEIDDLLGAGRFMPSWHKSQE